MTRITIKNLLASALLLFAAHASAIDVVGGVYQIGTAQDLKDFATYINTEANNAAANAVLTADIDMSGISDWTPIGDWVSRNGANTGYMGGTFDGQGHTISNFTFTQTGQFGGLFGVVRDVEIKNFKISGAMTAKYNYCAPISWAGNTSKISNIQSSVAITVEGNPNSIGGVVGQTNNKTSVSYCSFDGSIKAISESNNSMLGGIVGCAWTGNEAVSIDHCIFIGEIEGTRPGNYGGLAGRFNGAGCKVNNNISVGSVTTSNASPTECNALTSWMVYTVTNFNDNVYLIGSAPTICEKADVASRSTGVTAEDVESGRAAYLAGLYQEIGVDVAPTVDATHGKVYASGSLDCQMNAVGEVTYSNTQTDPTLLGHNIDMDGFCSVCGTLQSDEDGTYLIEDAAHLKWFASYVNAGNYNANAKLTADITLDSEQSFTGIGPQSGSSALAYTGTFDGQGHSITGFYQNGKASGWHGLFAHVSGTIKNFKLSGTLDINAKSNFNAAVCGFLEGGTIQDVYCDVNVNTNVAGTTHTGGIVGDSRNKEGHIIRCTYAGTLNAGTSTDCFGGIVGYNANVVIEDCLFSGIITAAENNAGNYFGGILGYSNTTAAKLMNNLSIGSILTQNGAAVVGTLRATSPEVYTNNYYLESTCTKGYGADAEMADITAQTIKVTSAQLASGEVTYKLNGETTGSWRQNLDTDNTPVLDATHAQVYATGTFTCNGVSKGNVVYVNTESSAIYDDHDYMGGYCTVCNDIDENYLPVTDGYYKIGNAEGLQWFANLVKTKKNTANAKLTADIDLKNVTWAPIGTTTSKYAGTFDGQGKTIKNFNYTTKAQGEGLFGFVTGTIKNLNVTGSLTTAYSWTGLIGDAQGNANIIGINSALEITANVGGTAIAVGGVVGQTEGTASLDACTFSGKITCENESNNPLVGGIVGCAWTGNNACSITNCIYTGEIEGTRNGNYGGFVGRFNAAGCKINHCLSAGKVTAAANATQASAFTSWCSGTAANITENYYLIGSASMVNATTALNAGCTGVTAEQLASGEVAYKLGEKFYQTIGTDNAPTLSSESQKVLYVGEAGYATMYDTTGKEYEIKGNATANIGALNPESGMIKLTPIADIPANTPVILKGTYYNKIETMASANTEGNQLVGTATDLETTGSEYILAKQDGVVGFYKATGTIPAGKAYFKSAADVKGFFFGEDENATGISQLNAQSSQLIYNIAGQRVSKMQKGINIVNGKKVLF